MSEKIPQRNINLGAKYNLLARHLMDCNQMLLENDPIENMAGILGALGNELFDTIVATKEFMRKVSPIELKGQRA